MDGQGRTYERDPVSSEEDDDLLHAYDVGQFSNVATLLFDPIQGGTSTQPSLIAVDVPAHQARTWQVTVLGLKAFGFPPSGLVGLPPPDNTAIAQYAENPGEGVSPLKLVLQWGTGGAMERALIDYYWGGQSFQVTGSNVRLSIQRTFPFVTGVQFSQATVSAIIASKSFATQLRPPTYTPFGATMAVAQTVIFQAPKRAQAYRVITADGAAFTVQLRQAFYTGATVAVDAVAYDPKTDAQRSSSGTWFPLFAGTQAIAITNNDGASARQVQVIWQLDIE